LLVVCCWSFVICHWLLVFLPCLPCSRAPLPLRSAPPCPPTPPLLTPLTLPLLFTSLFLLVVRHINWEHPKFFKTQNEVALINTLLPSACTGVDALCAAFRRVAFVPISNRENLHLSTQMLRPYSDPLRLKINSNIWDAPH
jgi:hypothetical protein